MQHLNVFSAIFETVKKSHYEIWTANLYDKYKSSFFHQGIKALVYGQQQILI